MRRIVLVAGARPNFIKIAPLMSVFRISEWAEPILVHTGQHFDKNMSDVFFDDLDIPEPKVNLGVGPGTQTEQISEIMRRFESVLVDENPDRVLVVGDVNSTLATALASVKKGVPVVHVEAGLRSYDLTMPEELNRRLTDHMSDLLFVSEPSGLMNLKNEGIDSRKVFHVGNVMIDSLLAHHERARGRRVYERFDATWKEYALVTFHRPSNVDVYESAMKLLECVEVAQRALVTIIPLHPRTERAFARFGLMNELKALKNVRLVPPQGYLDFLSLQDGAALVLTDSGGVQEETTVLGIPCLTMRLNTERPVTVDKGTSTIVNLDSLLVAQLIEDVLRGNYKTGSVPELWDGNAAIRMCEILRTSKV